MNIATLELIDTKIDEESGKLLENYSSATEDDFIKMDRLINLKDDLISNNTSEIELKTKCKEYENLVEKSRIAQREKWIDRGMVLGPDLLKMGLCACLVCGEWIFQETNVSKNNFMRFAMNYLLQKK